METAQVFYSLFIHKLTRLCTTATTALVLELTSQEHFNSDLNKSYKSIILRQQQKSTCLIVRSRDAPTLFLRSDVYAITIF